MPPSPVSASRGWLVPAVTPDEGAPPLAEPPRGQVLAPPDPARALLPPVTVTPPVLLVLAVRPPVAVVPPALVLPPVTEPPPAACAPLAPTTPPAPAVLWLPPLPPAAVDGVPPALRSPEPLLHPPKTKTAVSRLVWTSVVFLDMTTSGLDCMARLGLTNREYSMPKDPERSWQVTVCSGSLALWFPMATFRSAPRRHPTQSVGTTGAMVPSALNVILSTQISRWFPSPPGIPQR